MQNCFLGAWILVKMGMRGATSTQLERPVAFGKEWKSRNHLAFHSLPVTVGVSLYALLPVFDWKPVTSRIRRMLSVLVVIDDWRFTEVARLGRLICLRPTVLLQGARVRHLGGPTALFRVQCSDRTLQELGNSTTNFLAAAVGIHPASVKNCRASGTDPPACDRHEEI